MWLILPLMPIAVFVLESQGFYDRPAVCPRAKVLWPLFKGCLLTTIGLVLATYVFHLLMPRGVAMFFGCISFMLLFAKEELVRLAVRTKFAQFQYKRRFILVGEEGDIARMCRELEGHKDETIAIVAQFDLDAGTLKELVQLLHDQAVNGVILSAKRAHFELIENIIKLCELEGVEVWLLADFFATQNIRTSFDELFGRPLLIFRTAPDASWEGLVKQVMDFFGALALLVLVGSWLFPLIALAIKLSSPARYFSAKSVPA